MTNKQQQNRATKQLIAYLESMESRLVTLTPGTLQHEELAANVLRLHVYLQRPRQTKIYTSPLGISYRY